MNQQMPRMLTNFENHSWNTDILTESRLLSQQTVLIIGFGNIGSYCAARIKYLGVRVIGKRKSAEYHSPRDTLVFGVEQLPKLLPQADHAVLLLPGNEDTDDFMSPERLLACKPGAILYNFGRCNALRVDGSARPLGSTWGVFLDVTKEEPLAAESLL